MLLPNDGRMPESGEWAALPQLLHIRAQRQGLFSW